MRPTLAYAVPASLLRRFLVLASVMALLGTGCGANEEHDAASLPDIRQTDDAVMVEQIRRLQEPFDRLDRSTEAERTAAMASLRELASYDDPQTYLRCQMDPACFGNLLGSIVLLEGEGEYGWSDNILNIQAVAVDDASGRRAEIPFQVHVRNGRSAEGSASSKGFEYTLHGKTTVLGLEEVGRTRFTFIGVVRESRLGGSYWQSVNGFILDSEASAPAPASLTDRAPKQDASTMAPGDASDTTGGVDDFVSIVSTARDAARSAQNDMQRGALLAARNEAICRDVPMSVTGWHGTVRTLSADSEGNGILVVELAPGITLTNERGFSERHATLLKPGTADFQVATSLAAGETIQFDGSFMPGDPTCIDEGGFTLDSKLLEAEFPFIFRELRKTRS